MNRPLRILLLRWPTLLLAALTVAGASWLVADQDGCSPVARTAPGGRWIGPRLLDVQDMACRLPPRVGQTGPILPTAFPNPRDSAGLHDSFGPEDVSGNTVEVSIRPAPEDQATCRPGADPQHQPTVRMVWTVAEVRPANSEEDLPDTDTSFLDGEQLPLAPRESGQSTWDVSESPNRWSKEPDRAEREGPRMLVEPTGTLLPPPDEPTRRSEQLERIARQADRQIRRGFGLASRRAYFAARAEFVRALRLVAQGLDAERRTTTHSRSLAAGLKAIEEAEDFIPEGSRLEADLDLAEVIAGHGTPVLKDVDTQRLTPLWALRCYFTFAQEQLAAAAGREIAGSMALHALGKTHAALARNKVGDMVAAEPKSMVFFQAALLVFPDNYMAANDLGVLLADSGEYPEARTMLVRSLSTCSQSAGWRNLAVVHEQLGEFELARVAREQFATVRRAEIAHWRRLKAPSHRRVDWVSSDTFSRMKTEKRNVWQSSLPQNRK